MKVLIVEDSQEDTELLLLELKRGGFEPSYRRVDTPETMAEALDNGPWDVILSDYSMPRFSVSEALQAVRARNLDVPFLIVSATIVDEEAVAAMKAGAHDFIMKDRMARLAPAISREIRECQTRRERKTLEEQMRQSQRLESLGLLAGGVAHDFNNLLTGILGNASLALEILNPPEPARSMLESIVQASERAADLTRQLLAYAGRGKFVVRQIHLSQLIVSTGKLLQASIPKKTELRLELESDLPLTDGDPDQMRQLLLNLVVNAAEAIGEETGTLTIRTRASRPDDAMDDLPPGPYVVLEVKDTGVGMDESTKHRIFEPFFSTKFLGRGMGLAAALGIVHAHRGRIRVHSSPGSGSIFTIYLPAVAAAPKLQLDEGLNGIGTILVVDDEEVVRQTAKMALQRYGYHVLLAEDGVKAIEIVRRLAGEIRLVILDMTMPVMSGEEAFQHISEIAPNLPVIASTGYSQAEAANRFTGDQVVGFLQKPYTAPLLGRTVKAALTSSGLAGRATQ